MFVERKTTWRLHGICIQFTVLWRELINHWRWTCKISQGKRSYKYRQVLSEILFTNEQLQIWQLCETL